MHETSNLKIKTAQVAGLLILGAFLAVYVLQKQMVEGVTTYPLFNLQIAANTGSPAAQFNLANAYYRGDGVAKDYNAAKKWYLAAAEQGLPMAQWALSIYYSPTKGISQNEVVAKDWRRKALRSDDEVVRKHLCTVYYHDKDTGEVTLLSPKQYSSIWQDRPESPEFAKLRQMAERPGGQDLENRFNLGNAYYHAAYDYTGDEKDYQKAMELWASAAAWGYPKAQWALSYISFLGYKDVKGNEEESLNWWRQANPPGAYKPVSDKPEKEKKEEVQTKPSSPPKEMTREEKLKSAAEAYQKGNYHWALKLWLPLAEELDADTHFKLGFMHDDYISGQQGLDPNYPEAVKWYLKAAAGGIESAQFNLGLIYRDGEEGVPQDLVQAYRWFTIAEATYLEKETKALAIGKETAELSDAMSGRKRSVKELAELAAKMTPEQITEAERLAGVQEPEAVAPVVASTEAAATAPSAETSAVAAPVASEQAAETALSAKVEEQAEPTISAAEAQATPEAPQASVAASIEAPVVAAPAAVVTPQEPPEVHLVRGKAYYRGDGVPKDAREAMKWFRQAADRGHSDAQLYLGIAYHAGVGVERDKKEAAEWLRQSAAQGNKEAQKLLIKYGLGE